MLAQEIQKFLEGEMAEDNATLEYYSRDASLFDIRPAVVAFPKHSGDVKNLVKFMASHKKDDPTLSLSARSAGTDMSGGPLTESIVMDFTRHMNSIKEVGDRIITMEGAAMGYAVAEPGVYYRDFELETLKRGYLLPSYPASRNLCAIGGMVANDSGGEKSLIYGKTHHYVTALKVVFTDGEEYAVKPMNAEELKKKIAENTFESELYRKVRELLEKNYDTVKNAKPDVSKNSAGYNIWDVWDRNTFDLTKLLVGSQGTLGVVTEATFKLISVKEKPCSGMLVVFLNDLKKIADIVNAVLPYEPSSFESFDDHTLRLAMKFLWGFVKILAKNPFSLVLAFLPEFWMVVTKGMPKLVMMIEFEERTKEEVEKKIMELEAKLKSLGVKTRVALTKEAAAKYWAIRRESFNLLRQKVKGMQTAPFIDDIIVKPEYLPEFLPKLYAIGEKYQLLYTIAGHVGDGNFHVIPLMRLGEASERAKIKPAMDEVYDLVLKYKGSITAEHNDGLIRSPYLEQMFGAEVYKIFQEIKNIFDPQNIFNPGKKVNANMDYALKHIKRS